MRHAPQLLVTALLLFLAAGCDPVSPPGPLPFERVDAGVDAGMPCIGPLGPPCCDVEGQRLRSASCVEGQWSCEADAFCTCRGAPARGVCTDFCGSDAFVDPSCEADGWSCGALQSTETCPAGTCFGDPGECCLGPVCKDGAWRCTALKVPCE